MGWFEWIIDRMQGETGLRNCESATCFCPDFMGEESVEEAVTWKCHMGDAR